MSEYTMKPGEVWEKDGKRRKIVKFTNIDGEEVPSFYVAEDGLYDHLNVWWCRPEQDVSKAKPAWCATWMAWWKNASLVSRPWQEPGKNCHACKHSGMEPDDMNLTCYVMGGFGKHVRGEFGEHCDGGKKFEQHPGRNPDGTLK